MVNLEMQGARESLDQVASLASRVNRVYGENLDVRVIKVLLV